MCSYACLYVLNIHNKYSLIGKRTFPLRIFLNMVFSIVMMGNELIMVVRLVLREKQVNLLGFCCFLVLQEYHSQMRMKALPQC